MKGGMYVGMLKGVHAECQSSIDNATIIGRSTNVEAAGPAATRYNDREKGFGITTPRTDHFCINDVFFDKYVHDANHPKAVRIPWRSCASCNIRGVNSYGGARTVHFSQIKYGATITN